jgi:Fe2+ or Zn2+ uptake regulation protein
VVRRISTDEEFGRYELTEDLTGHHHHLVCSNCGAVEDVDFAPAFEETLETALAELAGRTGFSGVSHRLDLIGLCRTCAASATA